METPWNSNDYSCWCCGALRWVLSWDLGLHAPALLRSQVFLYFLALFSALWLAEQMQGSLSPELGNVSGITSRWYITIKRIRLVLRVLILCLDPCCSLDAVLHPGNTPLGNAWQWNHPWVSRKPASSGHPLQGAWLCARAVSNNISPALELFPSWVSFRSRIFIWNLFYKQVFLLNHQKNLILNIYIRL